MSQLIRRWMWVLAMPFITRAAAAGGGLHDYEGIGEGVIGQSFDHDGVTYHDANNVSGFYPDGQEFGPTDLGNDFIIENATLFYNDHPGFGSPINALTFGRSFVPGDNLSIGPLASVWMSFDAPVDSASLDIAFYENGPWGGIDWVMDAVRDGQVVASTRYTIADGGGRDNTTWTTLALDGVEFDEIHLYSWLNNDYTAARGMIDDLTFNAVPAPGALVLLGVALFVATRRRRAA